MPRKLTQEEVIEKFKTVHGDKYDYSLVDYIGIDNKVHIICTIHGLFTQTPYKHLKGNGCPKCGKIKAVKSKTKSNKQFIENSIKIHGNKYNYSLVDYIKYNENVKIICKEHGVFEISPTKHLDINIQRGCPRCSGFKTTTSDFIKKAISIYGYLYEYSLIEFVNYKTKINIICKEHGVFIQRPDSFLIGRGCQHCNSKTTDMFISDAIKIHGNKYDYSLVDYTGYNNIIEIICKEHDVFKQTPTCHLNGSGCPKCAKILVINKITKTTDIFINDAIKIHGNKYDYSLVDYTKGNEKVKIICKEHGVFKQSAYSHLRYNGCPKCKSSKGEIVISKILETNNINYITQKTFKECKDKRQLRFDFYISDINTLIEYDGRQHFISYTKFGGEKALLETKRRDQIKNDYCKTNNIRLIRIPYTEFNNIEDILKDKILIYKTNEK